MAYSQQPLKHDTIPFVNSSGQEDFMYGVNSTLIVNDDIICTMMLETLLKQCNSVSKKNIHKAKNGLEAYQLATKIKFDLILMDLNMDEMNGLEACKLIRKSIKTKINRISSIQGSQYKHSSLKNLFQ
jgi:CheY-like chemotaxis protein